MLAVVQRVSRANVRVKENIVGEIDGGLVILLGIEKGDDEKDATSLAHKISKLRMFNDDNDKMNLSILDVNGAALVISQFTLCADTKKGRRPSFLNAESPNLSNNLYELFKTLLIKNGLQVQSGEFGAMMDVQLVNNGPVTFILNSNT
tara:strand:- start:87 stop:530 length:444 start_codon:yes stop_codon:yes gene_type:complete